jgi:hypothetical protein
MLASSSLASLSAVLLAFGTVRSTEAGGCQFLSQYRLVTQVGGPGHAERGQLCQREGVPAVMREGAEPAKGRAESHSRLLEDWVCGGARRGSEVDGRSTREHVGPRALPQQR